MNRTLGQQHKYPNYNSCFSLTVRQSFKLVFLFRKRLCKDVRLGFTPEFLYCF